MPDSPRSRLAVLGSPIAHSKSPALHAAAYRALGLEWTYSAVEMTGPQLTGFVGSRNSGWRGLSLTMPLKRDILPMLDSTDDLVELTGGANTVLFTNAGIAGFNTDVYGVTQALRDRGARHVTAVQVLGAGATAASVIVAAASLGATDVLVSARSPERARSLLPLANRLGVRMIAAGFDEAASITPDLVVSTLPGGSIADLDFPAEVLAGATFLDVAYDPWPTPLAARWLEAGGAVISGLEMLVNQALGQVRIFVSGSIAVQLTNEELVLAAMRDSVGLGPVPRT